MADSVHMQCIDSVAKIITALDLDGRPKVHKKKLPTERGIDPTKACIVVSLPDSRGENPVGGLNMTNDIDYPVIVSFVMPADQNLEMDPPTDKWLMWRENVFLKFHNRNPMLDDVDEVFICKVTPNVIVDVSAFLNSNVCAGALQINCRARRFPIP